MNLFNRGFRNMLRTARRLHHLIGPPDHFNPSFRRARSLERLSREQRMTRIKIISPHITARTRAISETRRMCGSIGKISLHQCKPGVKIERQCSRKSIFINLHAMDGSLHWQLASACKSKGEDNGKGG